MNKPFEAIIFDMDGTIIDSEKLSKLSFKKVADIYNITIDDDFIFSIIGKTMDAAKEMYINKYGDHNYTKIFDTRRKIYNEIMTTQGLDTKGDLNLVFDTLVSKGYKLALCTSAPKLSTEKKLKIIGQENRFNVIITGDDVINGKPHPSPYLKVAELLNLDPSKCLVIEDSPNGIISANKAGMQVINIEDEISIEQEILNLCYDKIVSLDELNFKEYLG